MRRSAATNRGKPVSAASIETAERERGVAAKPRYDLNNAEGWMRQVAAQIGTDKQLPRAAHPGLAGPQIHHVNAMFLASKRRVAMRDNQELIRHGC